MTNPPDPSSTSGPPAEAASVRDLTVAVVLFATSMFVLVGMDTIAKWLSDRMNPLFITWARYASQMLILLLIFGPGIVRLMRAQHLKLQLLRSVLMLGATLFFFSGLAVVDLHAAMAIIFVSPLFVVALAGPVLGEKVGPRRWIAVGVGMIGMLLVVRPGTDTFSWGALLILGAALCYGSQQLATRHVATGDSASTTLVFTALIGAIVMSFAAPFVWVTPDWTEAIALVGLGVIATLGHWMLIKALALAPASVLAPLDYTALIWGTLAGMLVFNEVLHPLTVVGAVIIAAAGLFVYWRERQAARTIKPEEAVPPGS